VRRREREVGRCHLVLDRGENGALIGRLVGEIDRLNAGELAELLRPMQEAPGVALDLEQITFVDLTAARALAALVDAPNGVQVVASPGSPCGRLLSWLASFADVRLPDDDGAC
jgi:STAS domain